VHLLGRAVVVLALVKEGATIAKLECPYAIHAFEPPDDVVREEVEWWADGSEKKVQVAAAAEAFKPAAAARGFTFPR